MSIHEIYDIGFSRFRYPPPRRAHKILVVSSKRRSARMLSHAGEADMPAEATPDRHTEIAARRTAEAAERTRETAARTTGLSQI